jgi:hypothetical protein
VQGGLPQTLVMPPPPQVSGAVQVPQSIMAPQPLFCMPQEALSCWQVKGTQGPVPHLFAPPPPQYAGAVQLPQSTTPLHPSACNPHMAPICEHVSGVQVVPELELELVPELPLVPPPVPAPELELAPPPVPAPELELAPPPVPVPELVLVSPPVPVVEVVLVLVLLPPSPPLPLLLDPVDPVEVPPEEQAATITIARNSTDAERSADCMEPLPVRSMSSATDEIQHTHFAPLANRAVAGASDVGLGRAPFHRKSFGFLAPRGAAGADRSAYAWRCRRPRPQPASPSQNARRSPGSGASILTRAPVIG